MAQVIIGIASLLIAALALFAQLYGKEVRTWIDDPPAEERKVPQCECPPAQAPPSPAPPQSTPSPQSPVESAPPSGTSIDVEPPQVTELDPDPTPENGRTFDLDDPSRKPSSTRITLEDQ